MLVRLPTQAFTLVFAHISPCAKSGLVPFFFPSCTASKCASRDVFSPGQYLLSRAPAAFAAAAPTGSRLEQRRPSATACRQWAALPAPLHIICLSAASPQSYLAWVSCPGHQTTSCCTVCRLQSPTAKPCSDSAVLTLQRLPVQSLCECESALCRLPLLTRQYLGRRVLPPTCFANKPPPRHKSFPRATPPTRGPIIRPPLRNKNPSFIP